MTPDSTFVSQMFCLIDKDLKGYISFRDMIYTVALFTKGMLISDYITKAPFIIRYPIQLAGELCDSRLFSRHLVLGSVPKTNVGSRTEDVRR